jgi:hypothetical protein
MARCGHERAGMPGPASQKRFSEFFRIVQRVALVSGAMALLVDASMISHTARQKTFAAHGTISAPALPRV